MIASGILGLAPREIHVWAFCTEVTQEVFSQFHTVLSPDEHARAVSFRFDSGRRQYTVTRGVLRCMLGVYLGNDPASLEIAHTQNGKPFLSSEINFNGSHSERWSVLAFTVGCGIGIDVERIRPIADMEQIARSFFCTDEAEEILALESGSRDRAFFQCWTRKEAYLKATGAGLSVSLDTFSIQPSEDDYLQVITGGRPLPSWTVQDLHLGREHLVAIAYDDRPRSRPILRVVDPAQIITGGSQLKILAEER